MLRRQSYLCAVHRMFCPIAGPSPRLTVPFSSQSFLQHLRKLMKLRRQARDDHLARAIAKAQGKAQGKAKKKKKPVLKVTVLDAAAPSSSSPLPSDDEFEIEEDEMPPNGLATNAAHADPRGMRESPKGSVQTTEDNDGEEDGGHGSDDDRSATPRRERIRVRVLGLGLLGLGLGLGFLQNASMNCTFE